MKKAVQIAVYLYSNKNNSNLKDLKFTTEFLSYKILKQDCSNSRDIKLVSRHLLVCTEQSEMHQSQCRWHSSKVLNKLVCHLLVLYLQQLTSRLLKETTDMYRSTEED